MKATEAKPTNITDYISRFPPAVKRVLTRVRRTLRKALPGAEEAISYGIPAYKVRGRVVIYFAGWRQHYSIYPATAALARAFKKELAPYEVNNKGTIRFPLDAPVPVDLIAGIARYRAKETLAAAAAKTPSGGTRGSARSRA
jgi:uncharacterized protein YdhG (YjbR/CyaY superfamily)